MNLNDPSLKKSLISPKTGNGVTPRARMHFVSVHEKFLSKDDKAKGKTVEKDGAYVCVMVASPDCDLSALEQLLEEKRKAKWPDRRPVDLKSPIRKCSTVKNKDGFHKYPEELHDHWQITANQFGQRPNVVDPDQKPLSTLAPDETPDDVKERLEREAYNGRWGRMSVAAHAYSNDGNQGVKFYLQNLQLLDHDDKIGGRIAKPEDEFTPVSGVTDTDEVDSAEALWS